MGRFCAAYMAAAAVPVPWQSMSEAMSPPYTYPGTATWYGAASKRATASSPSQKLRRCRPLSLRRPQP